MTPEQMAALANWIREECRCAVAFKRVDHKTYRAFRHERTKAMQKFWEVMGQ